MAGTAVISTIKHDVSGAPPVIRDGNNTEIVRFCRAFLNLDGSVPSVRGSFNISSVTKNSTGNWSPIFTINLPDAYYGVGYLGCDSNAYISGFNDSNTPPTSSSFRALTLTGSFSLSNSNYTTWVVNR